MESINKFLEKFDLNTYLKRGSWFSNVIQEWIRTENESHPSYEVSFEINAANLWEELKYLVALSENWQNISDGHKRREQGMFYQAKYPLDFNGWLSTLDFFWTYSQPFGGTEEFNWTCSYCGKAIYPSTEFTIFEHFRPISQFGGWETGNILPACSSCNRKKVESIPTIWLWDISYSESRLWNAVRFLSWFRYFEHHDYLIFRTKLDRILKQGYFPFIVRVSELEIIKKNDDYFYNHWKVQSGQRTNIGYFEDYFLQLAIKMFEGKGHLRKLWQLANQEKTTKSILGLPVLKSPGHTKNDYEQKSFDW